MISLYGYNYKLDEESEIYKKNYHKKKAVSLIATRPYISLLFS